MADRPLDCTECKRPLAVCYTEIVDNKMTRTVMCASCPHLEKRLYGIFHKVDSQKEHMGTALACGNCGVSLDAIRMGHLLGCGECYSVFGETLTDELLKENRISRHLTSNKKTQPLHIGRAPGEVTEISPTLKLIALNEALDETLIREDYEQAALLRDQIREIKEKADNDQEK